VLRSSKQIANNLGWSEVLVCWMIICVSLSILITGCSPPKSVVECNALVSQHFLHLSKNDISSALTNYDGRFFAKTPELSWSNTLAGLSEKCGKYQKHNITRLDINKRAGDVLPGMYVTLFCSSTYSKFPAVEKFVLFKPDGDDSFKIIEHYIQSDAFKRDD
jgi:hypothetical protein